MDNAAINWGCACNPAGNPPRSSGNGNWSKWYGTSSDSSRGCGLVFWNHAKQAAYFVANSEIGGRTSNKLLQKYALLGYERGVLGLPISNPTSYGSSGTTYQQFTNGIITYVAAQRSAFHVGGTTPEYKALADRYTLRFGISPTSGPEIYGLAQEVSCTQDPAISCSNRQSGRYLIWWDPKQHTFETIIARNASNTAIYVPGQIQREWVERFGPAPWRGSLGFPITDLLPTGSASFHQEFQGGTILWELSNCNSGRYRARVVSQFRRPITAADLSMLCEKAPPLNNVLVGESAEVPFNLGRRKGTYSFTSGRDGTGWFKGVTIRFENEQPIEVSGAFYSSWIGKGRTTINEALLSGVWGEPTGNPVCENNPCKIQKQNFANGAASIPVGGVVIWDPVEEGLKIPIGFGPIERGYTNPPMPEDRRTPIGHRSGDYITLAWFNKATLANVTTRVFRSVTPLNGSAGSWTLIKEYLPPTLAAGTFTTFTDNQATNNAKNCYLLSVSDGTTTERTSAVCSYTLDGTTDSNGIDRSIPRGVSRAQIRIGIAGSPSDSGTTKAVSARLNSFAGGFDYNFTYLDSTGIDFTLNSVRTYDLLLTGISDVSDIVGITVQSYRDNMRITSVQLRLDNVGVFSRSYDPPVLVSNSDLLGGSKLEVGFDELRSNALWKDAYNTRPFTGFTADDFRSKLDGALANAIFNMSGAAYYGSRLRDAFPSTLSKPPNYQRDRLHVRQHITAWADLGIFCSLDYDLRITAQDIQGNEISPFYNGPSYSWDLPLIYTTSIKVENPSVDCGTTFMRNLFLNLTKPGFPLGIRALEDELEHSLQAQAPSRIQSSPRANFHFCFPGTGEGFGGQPYRNGGLTICADE